MKNVNSSSAPLSQPVQRNRHRLAEIERPAEHQRAVEGDERVGDVAARRAVDDQAAEARHQEREERHRSPLPRRHPDLIGQQQHRDDAAVGGIEDVLAAEADDELAGDGDDGRQDRQVGPVGAEQQAQRQARR